MKHKEIKRIVVKIGTSTLTHETGKPNLKRLDLISRVLSDLKNAGLDVILVSSGAISVGLHKMGIETRPKDTPSRQAASAVGQCALMSMYDKFFAQYGQSIAQMLLTRDVIDDEIRKNNVVNTFNALFESGIIPIINENDTVSTVELEGIAFGDNDRLSAIVAVLTKADALVILTDQDGLFDFDPRTNENAKLIPYVENIEHEIENGLLENIGGKGTVRGTGGMKTKIEAARLAVNSGTDIFIINGDKPELLYDITGGGFAGTFFKSIHN